MLFEDFLLGLEGDAVAELVGVLVVVPGVNEETEGSLDVRAELLGVAEANLAAGVEPGLEGGITAELVLGAKLNGNVLLGAAPGGLTGDADGAGDHVVEGGDELGELPVAVEGDGIVALRVAEGHSVVADGARADIEGTLATGHESLVREDGVELDLGAREDVGGQGGQEGVSAEGAAELDLLLGGVGVEGGLEISLDSSEELGGLDLDNHVVGGGIGVSEGQARVGVLQLGLDLSLEGAVGIVALKKGAELLHTHQEKSNKEGSD